MSNARLLNYFTLLFHHQSEALCIVDVDQERDEVGLEESRELRSCILKQ